MASWCRRCRRRASCRSGPHATPRPWRRRAVRTRPTPRRCSHRVLLRVAAVPNSVVYGRPSISSAPPPFYPRLRFSTVVRTIAPDASVIPAPRTPHRTGRRTTTSSRSTCRPGRRGPAPGRHAGCPIALHRRPAGSPAPAPMPAMWSPSRSCPGLTWRRPSASTRRCMPLDLRQEHVQRIVTGVPAVQVHADDRLVPADPGGADPQRSRQSVVTCTIRSS